MPVGIYATSSLRIKVVEVVKDAKEAVRERGWGGFTDVAPVVEQQSLTDISSCVRSTFRARKC